MTYAADVLCSAVSARELLRDDDFTVMPGGLLSDLVLFILFIYLLACVGFYSSYHSSFIGCIKCMRCRLLLLMFAVSVSLSGHLSVMQFKSAAACAVYAACCVHGVIRCSLRQMPSASCLCMCCHSLSD